jgi:hypothetical protein
LFGNIQERGGGGGGGTQTGDFPCILTRVFSLAAQARPEAGQQAGSSAPDLYIIGRVILEFRCSSAPDLYIIGLVILEFRQERSPDLYLCIIKGSYTLVVLLTSTLKGCYTGNLGSSANA